jgi:hypothetical protein
MKELIDLEYEDGMTIAFTDGEVVFMCHKGANRMGKEWDNFLLYKAGSVVKELIAEPTHVLGGEYECIVFDSVDAFKEWIAIEGRKYVVDVLDDLGMYDEVKYVRNGGKK